MSTNHNLVKKINNINFKQITNVFKPDSDTETNDIPDYQIIGSTADEP